MYVFLRTVNHKEPTDRIGWLVKKWQSLCVIYDTAEAETNYDGKCYLHGDEVKERLKYRSQATIVIDFE